MMTGFWIGLVLGIAIVVFAIKVFVDAQKKLNRDE